MNEENVILTIPFAQFGCPFKNAYEFVENSEKKMGPEVLGESGMMFLKKAKEAFNPNPLPRLLKALKIK